MRWRVSMQSVPSGSAPFTLSVLAGGGTGIGTTVEQGLESTISLARAADRRGFRRFWMSEHQDRKSTRLNSSHVSISYAVFCLKKKNKNTHRTQANEARGTHC